MPIKKLTEKSPEHREEEVKCANFNLKKIEGGNNNKLVASKKEQEIEQTTGDQLTPRLENPVSMLRRKNSSDESDEIPNERMEPIRLVPLLNVTKVLRIHTRRNMSQLLMHNRSGYSFITPSLLSHE